MLREEDESVMVFGGKCGQQKYKIRIPSATPLPGGITPYVVGFYVSCDNNQTHMRRMDPLVFLKP